MDSNGVPNSVRGILRSLGPLVGMDTFGLVEETIARPSFQRNYALVNTGSLDRKLSRMGQAVIVPLKSGLQSFIEVSEILLRVRDNMVPSDSQTFRDIRGRIVSMKQQMECSESIAAGELAELDQQTELLTQKQGQLASEKRQEELALYQLQKNLDSYRSTVDNLRDSLNDHRRNRESAEESLESMRRRREDAAMARNVGLALSPLLVGIPLALAGKADMDQASIGIRAARAEVDECDSQVRLYRNKISECQNQMFEIKRKIGEADDNIYRTQGDLRALSGRREAVAAVQAKMRSVLHHLGVLSGVGSVAELHTRRQVLLQPVVNVMGEMTTALGRITGEQLLNAQGIGALVERMKSNQQQLQQLGTAAQAGNLDYY